MLECEIIQQRSRAELTGIRLKMIELIVPGNLKNDILRQRMITADFEIMSALGSDRVVGQVVRLCGRPYRIQVHKGDRFQLRRCKESSIKGMEYIGLIDLIRRTDSRTQLSL